MHFDSSVSEMKKKASYLKIKKKMQQEETFIPVPYLKRKFSKFENESC